jgi:hypothetical protein
MNSYDCYAEFKAESILVKNFVEFFKNIPIKNRTGFQTHPVEKKYWIKEPVLSQIHNQFPIEKCGIMKMLPYTSYDWHTDETRGVCINWLIEHTDSHCLFGEKIDDYNLNIIRIPYESNKFFLFNNQILHTVTNFEGNRYVFTIVFEKQKDDLCYKTVYNWCKEQDLLHE